MAGALEVMETACSVVGEISFADLTLNCATREARCGERRVVIKHTGCRVLAQLVASAGATVTRRTLLLNVWGFDFDPGTKVLEVQMSHLRQVLLALGSTVSVRTHRCVGYWLG